MPDPIRIFKRLRRKILPRKVRARVADFFWHIIGILLQASGVVVFLWGVVLFFRSHHSVPVANGAPTNESAKKFTCLIVGLGIFALGYSILKMHRHTKGQIDSVFFKNARKNNE